MHTILIQNIAMGADSNPTDPTNISTALQSPKAQQSLVRKLHVFTHGGSGTHVFETY